LADNEQNQWKQGKQQGRDEDGSRTIPTGRDSINGDPQQEQVRPGFEAREDAVAVHTQKELKGLDERRVLNPGQIFRMCLSVGELHQPMARTMRTPLTSHFARNGLSKRAPENHATRKAH
jgi:hypothetical protein